MSRHLDTHAGRSTVGDALNLRRRSLPRLPLLVGFVRSCLHFAASYGGRGGGPGVLEWYRGAWHRLRRALSEVAREEGGGRSATAPGKEAELVRWRQSRPLVPLDSGLPAEVVTLADTLRAVVRSRQCSIRQVAGAVFVSPATMSRYLNGHRVPPRNVVDNLAAFAAPGPGDGTALRTMLHELRWKALNATGPRTPLTVELAKRLNDTHSRTGALDAEVTRLKSEVTDLTTLLQQAYEDAQQLSAARRSTWGRLRFRCRCRCQCPCRFTATCSPASGLRSRRSRAGWQFRCAGRRGRRGWSAPGRRRRARLRQGAHSRCLRWQGAGLPSPRRTVAGTVPEAVGRGRCPGSRSRRGP
ncbi:helix-turn-helix domain-containing protein [Kitasatospora sp. NPDC058048]|uniref:helix-turn-helix domain-containing protein n=1 Tax=Kitasatospora sp. NPDC058048 TaxID=3346313 RepID=UPI0036DD962B